ncbi:MAG: hypothetical protein JXQ99_16330 [Hyphomicrobiaceae bacterium]
MRLHRIVLAYCLVFFTIAFATSEAFATNDLSFKTFYEQSWGGWLKGKMTPWVVGTLAMAGTGIVVWATGGFGVLIPSIGTAIGSAMGYSGIVATNYGLALLGGGSLASGGYGVAGGVALLTVALATVQNSAIETTRQKIVEHYDDASFGERAKRLAKLAPPTHLANNPEMSKILRKLRQQTQSEAKKLKIGKGEASVEKQRAFQKITAKAARAAILKIQTIDLNKSDAVQYAQQMTVLAILSYAIDDYRGARIRAEQALVSFLNEAWSHEFHHSDPALRPKQVKTPAQKMQLINFAIEEKTAKRLAYQGENYSIALAVWSLAIQADGRSNRNDLARSYRALEAMLATSDSHNQGDLAVALFLDLVRERRSDDIAKRFEEIGAIVERSPLNDKNKKLLMYVIAVKAHELMFIYESHFMSSPRVACSGRLHRRLQRMSDQYIDLENFSIANLAKLKVATHINGTDALNKSVDQMFNKWLKARELRKKRGLATSHC